MPSCFTTARMIGCAWRFAVPLAVLIIVLPTPLAAAELQRGHSEALFLGEVILLLVCGRLLGEAMQRVGQPAIMGQLLAGILLGPSIFGVLAPDLQHALFPGNKEQANMIGAVSQLGILMLLLLTGMETDLALVRRAGAAALGVSIAGIAVPFACGIALGELLPAHLLPDPNQRLITTLFLGTALAISSVKIVAMTIRELDFMRRTLGQLTVAAAIIDDTIGWIILAIIIGIAQHGGVDLASLAQTVAGTLLFLALSLTFGRRLVFIIIRWVNDNFVSDFPVITVILLIMGVMALITNAIGVHTVLGAFVAGMLVGQSPILTRHIDEQLRGLIVALFMPVFFGLAGLSANIEVLAQPSMLALSGLLILIASLGKFSGAFLGGAFAGMTWRESVALGCGMNARGSTEVIVATIGLTAGALSQSMFTMILAMAVITTMAMPPMLRWALAHVPLQPDEKARLEREEFEEQGFVTNMERLLVAVDESPSGQFASRIVGRLAGSLRLPTTIVNVEPEPATRSRRPARHKAKAEALAQALAEDAQPDSDAPDASIPPVDITTRKKPEPAEEAVAEEARKGYDFLVIGIEPVATEGVFDEKMANLAAQFDGPQAIVAARGNFRRPGFRQVLDILVPVTGTAYSRHGAEVAMALARADYGTVTALYVAAPAKRPWQREVRSALALGRGGNATLREIVEIGDRLGVPVRTAVRTSAEPASAILNQARAGKHNLIVMGVSPRAGEVVFFGDVSAGMLARSDRSMIFVAS